MRWRSAVLAMIGTIGTFFANLGYATETNGIVVGEPKQFPTRHLELMVEDLDRQLEQLRFISGAPLSEALGTVQGHRARSVERSGDVRTLPTPQIVTSREPNDEGNLAVKSEQTTVSAQSPAPPELSGGGATLPVDGYGFSAQDLLTEQVNLQYQVYNLRALLNRALGDRYYSDGSGTTWSRLQVLLGFQISVDTPKKHRGQAAVVEIAVRHRDSGKNRPSLVAVMPQEKTYNAAALSKKSNAFGGAALTSIVTLGYTEKRTGETFYLYHDADTVAFEGARDPEAHGSLSFGWQFRPVLDRPGVEAGLRQMFVVLALDEKDPPASGSPVELDIEAKTYWVPFDRKRRMTKGKPTDTSTSSLAKPFSVLSTSDLEKGLTPKVTAVAVETRDQNVLIKLEGENFFHDASVAVGDRVLSPGSSSFVVHSNTRLEFVVPKEDLFETISLAGGRYSFPAPIELDDGAAGDGCGIEQVNLTAKAEVKGDYRDVSVQLHGWRRACDLPERSVFLRFGNDVYELPRDRWDRCGETYKTSLEVPAEKLREDQEYAVVIPFLGSRFRQAARYHPPAGATEIHVLEAGEPTVWGIFGHGFSETLEHDGETIAGGASYVRLYAGKQYSLGNGLERVDDHLLKLSARKAELEKVKKVVIRVGGRATPIVLDAPKSPTAGPTPEASASSTAMEVARNSSPHVVFARPGLEKVERVTYGGAALTHRLSSDKKLTVFLTREVTKEKGSVSLVAHTAAGELVPLEIRVK